MEPNIKRIMDAFDLELAEASGQRTQAWRDIRAGKFTASEWWRLMGSPQSKKAKEAGEFSDEANTYINIKVGEELTGQIHDSPSANSLEWGIDMEPLAKEHFTLLTGMPVSASGFKVYNAHAGGSTDGHVGAEEYPIEIKCAYNSGNHIGYLRLTKGIEIKTEYPKIWWQLQANLLFNDKSMGYFVGFDPRFPEKQKMKILPVYALGEDQEKIKIKLDLATKEKIKIIESLTKLEPRVGLAFNT
jgi:hypothetical protein